MYYLDELSLYFNSLSYYKYDNEFVNWLECFCIVLKYVLGIFIFFYLLIWYVNDVFL